MLRTVAQLLLSSEIGQFKDFWSSIGQLPGPWRLAKNDFICSRIELFDENLRFLHIFEFWRACSSLLDHHIGLETTEIESPEFLDEL